MRFIIREQEYEKLLAAGRLKYRSGAFESWRLTEAIDGYTIMRIDLDRRDTGSASTTLIHLLLDAGGRLERTKLRHYSPHSDISVDALVDRDSLSISRSAASDLSQDEFDLPRGFGLMLPGVVGMALLVRSVRAEKQLAMIVLDPAQRYAPRRASMEISAMAEETFVVTGQTVAVRPYLIRHDETNQKIWLDSYGLPVRIDDEEGLKAVKDRYVRHN